ncbi:MAG TPA: hypothetical protein PKJ33_04035 [Alphaproteobacteria bacterium]|nr:hypothetical protein [Alphaproteobacteria bacterium]
MKKYFLVLFLAACGFSPLYSDKQVDVYVAPISGTNGIDLRNALNAEFGGGKDEIAKYKLVIKLDEPTTKYKAIQQTGDATWQEVQLEATYVLSKDKKEIAKSREVAAESYTFVRYLVAANASYNNAVQNSIKILANKIGTRIIVETSKDENKSE